MVPGGNFQVGTNSLTTCLYGDYLKRTGSAAIWGRKPDLAGKWDNPIIGCCAVAAGAPSVRPQIQTQGATGGKVVHSLSLGAVLFIVWLLLSGHYDPLTLSYGVFSCALVVVISVETAPLLEAEGSNDVGKFEPQLLLMALGLAILLLLTHLVFRWRRFLANSN